VFNAAPLAAEFKSTLRIENAWDRTVCRSACLRGSEVNAPASHLSR
jgi:hypothetical protein